MDSYIILPTRRYYSNVKLLQYFSTGGKKIFSAAGADKRSWVDMPEGELLSILPAHMGTIFFVKVAKKFFSCVHGSKMLPGEVMFLAAIAWVKGGVKGKKEIFKNSIKMKPVFYNFDLTFCCGKLHNFSIAKK